MKRSFLLSLLPPSWIVVSIRDLGNLTQSSAIMSYNSSNLVPSQDINMAVNPVRAMFDLNNNYNEVRGHSLDMSIHRPRSPSISLSECNEEYHTHVQWESDKIIEDEPTNFTGSIKLEYATQNNQVSKVADIPSNMRQ